MPTNIFSRTASRKTKKETEYFSYTNNSTDQTCCVSHTTNSLYIFQRKRDTGRCMLTSSNLVSSIQIKGQSAYSLLVRNQLAVVARYDRFDFLWKPKKVVLSRDTLTHKTKVLFI